MKEVPNKLVADVARYLAVLVEGIEKRKDTVKLRDTIRLSKKAIQQLRKISDDNKSPPK